MADYYHIRLAHESDLPALPGIERRAAILFQDYGLADTFATVVTPVDSFRQGLENRRLWVAAGDVGRLLGFALAGIVGFV